MNTPEGPYIPLPTAPDHVPCFCGSGRRFDTCCRPRLNQLNRAMGELEKWRLERSYQRTFRAFSDLLWEEQYRDEEQGRLAQEYDEWDEWASFLWLEGVVLDGFALPGVSPVPEAIQTRLRAGRRLPGGRRTYEALWGSCEGLYQIHRLPAGDQAGTAELWMPPCEERIVRMPRLFLPIDTQKDDLVIARLVPLGPLVYPTHRPLVIPVLPDGSNLDAVYRVMAALFPVDADHPSAADLMVRTLKARPDLIMRAALEALLPEESCDAESGSPHDGGEIRFMVSDAGTVESYLDNNPFFAVRDVNQFDEADEEWEDLLGLEESTGAREDRYWSLRIPPEPRRRLRPIELTQIESLLRVLARRFRPHPSDDLLERVAENPGVLLRLDPRGGILTLRALFAPALHLGRMIIEREAGAFLARESENGIAT